MANELDKKIQLIAERYGNDLSAFLRDAYGSFPEVPPDDDGCLYDYSWCVAKRHKDGYCYYHWLIESSCREKAQEAK